MTRKLNALLAAIALLAGGTTATVVFAAQDVSAPQKFATQIAMTQMTPDQMAQMTPVTANKNDKKTTTIPHFQFTHSGGR